MWSGVLYVQETTAQHWQAVLSKLSSQIGPQSFETWFSCIELLRFDSDQIELGVANRFIREWLRDHYLPSIRQAVSDVLGATPEISFTVSGKAFREMRRKQEAEQPTPVPPQPRAGTTLALNRDFRLDEFIVGSSNRVAHAACLAVTEHPAMVYNPLFVYGGAGLGKTHLLQGICHAVRDRDPNASVAYVSCEEFVNGYINAIQSKRLDEFRAMYRSLDLLAIDDIHFLGSKTRTQDEFLYTFDSLRNMGKQVVLSSDAHAREISALQNKLVDRFLQGLTTRVSPPDFETRVAILRRKAARRGLDLDETLLEETARLVTSNVRELEGALAKIAAQTASERREADLPLVRAALREFVTSRDGPVTFDEIANAVETQFGVSVSDLRSRKRTRKILKPRQLAMYVAKRTTDHSLGEIGSYFGGRDHATVIHADKRVREELTLDPELRLHLESVFRCIGRPVPNS
jgi:chromosomal replication initiator protein